MRRGFTLIELLIVLALLAATIAVVVPSFNALPATQVSHASRELLRVMRYARNMALQMQTPMVLSFAPGELKITPENTQGPEMIYTVAQLDAAYEAEMAQREHSEEKEASDTPTVTSAKATAAVIGGTLEDAQLTRRYEKVAFAFEGYDDTILNEGYERRISETPKPTGDTFSITIRTNGTIRPFTLRVYERENEEAEGRRISFDFLCSGTIHDES